MCCLVEGSCMSRLVEGRHMCWPMEHMQELPVPCSMACGDSEPIDCMSHHIARVNGCILANTTCDNPEMHWNCNFCLG